MATLYKLTDENDRTFMGCQWGENVTVEKRGNGGLFTAGVTHWYTHPLLAVLLSPLHGRHDLRTAHLWEGRGEVVAADERGAIIGCRAATTLRRIEMPDVNQVGRRRFAIMCAKSVYSNRIWDDWADSWLSQVLYTVPLDALVALASAIKDWEVGLALSKAAALSAIEAVLATLACTKEEVCVLAARAADTAAHSRLDLIAERETAGLPAIPPLDLAALAEQAMPYYTQKYTRPAESCI